MGTAQKPLRYILRRGYKTKTSRDAAITSLYAAAEYADTLSLLPVKSLTAKSKDADSMSRPELAALVRELRLRGEATVADSLVSKLTAHDDSPWLSDPAYQAAVAALEDVEAKTKDTRSIRIVTEAGAEVSLTLESLLL